MGGSGIAVPGIDRPPHFTYIVANRSILWKNDAWLRSAASQPQCTHPIKNLANWRITA